MRDAERDNNFVTITKAGARKITSERCVAVAHMLRVGLSIVVPYRLTATKKNLGVVLFLLLRFYRQVVVSVYFE